MSGDDSVRLRIALGIMSGRLDANGLSFEQQELLLGRPPMGDEDYCYVAELVVHEMIADAYGRKEEP